MLAEVGCDLFFQFSSHCYKSKVFTFNNEFCMRKLRRSWNWAFVTLLSIYFFSACEKKDERDTFIPFLTERLWKGDTITINPPLTYEQLSIEDQQSFHTARFMV